MNIESMNSEKVTNQDINTSVSDINDKRVDKEYIRIKETTDLNDQRIKESNSQSNNEIHSETKNQDIYYSTLKERIDQTPTENSGLGTWEGERGESKFIPADEETKICLERFGVDGIEYKNGIPDFDPVTLEKVQIEMGTTRYSVRDGEKRISGNYEKADTALAKKWNSEKKDGKTDWTKDDVKDWVLENRLVRHENNDMKTVSYIPFEPHVVCIHLGGVCECKKREMAQLGGGFDE